MGRLGLCVRGMGPFGVFVCICVCVCVSESDARHERCDSQIGYYTVGGCRLA